MATVSKFEDLEIWQKARIFCQWMHQIVKNTSLKKDFRLKDQIEASSGSVMGNIAEGFERSGNKEFIRFLFISKVSAGEAHSQLYRLFNQNYISDQQLNEQREFLESLSKQINRFINYLKNTEHRGWHFKEDQAELGQRRQ